MRRHKAALLCLLTLFGAAAAALAAPAAPPISGVVRHLESPISGALVLFYNLGETSLTRSRTSSDGTFVLASASAGVYDLVAYKKGFLPALVRLWHQAVPERVSSVQIELAAKADSSSPRDSPSSLWELRSRLPADVLRELALEEISDSSASSLDRTRLDRLIGGEVRTVADLAAQGTASLSRTAVGVHGGLPNGWKYDLRGEYAAVMQNDAEREGVTSGNASGLALDVETSPLERIRVMTRRHTVSFGDDRPASLQTHGVAWSRGKEEGYAGTVAARYVEETNLYRSTALGTSFFPLASRTWEVNGRYSRPAGETPGVALAMSYRHRDATVGPSGVGSRGVFFFSAPDADLSASTSVRLSGRAELEGGLVARYLADGYGIAPRVMARYDLGKGTLLFLRGLYRIAEDETGRGTVLPRVASLEENSEPASEEAYSFGIERRKGDDSALRVEVSTQRMDEVVRSFFEGDFLTDFDSVYLFDGNTVWQYQVSARQRLSESLDGTMALRYGSIDGEVAEEASSSYGISGSRGHFWSARAAVEVRPTRTGVAVLVRGVRQALEQKSSPARLNDSDKLSLSVSQDLSVLGVTPFGSVWKVLVAVEAARSTATTDREDPPLTNRLLGGLSLAF